MGAFLWLAASAAAWAPVQGGECGAVSVGVDSSLANGWLGTTILGRAVGQSFYAPATQVGSITVWRTYQQDSLGFGIRIFICRVDSNGTPITSSPHLLDGPTLTVPYGDGIHSIPFHFTFAPPFELPSPGYYSFFLQVIPCDGWSDFLACPNPYPDGSMWKTARSLEIGCVLRAGPNNFPNSDLAFDIEFCDAVTPIKRSTWGSIKALYR